MRDVDRAKQLLETGSYTCVLCKDGEIKTSAARGVAPFVEWISSGADTEGFSAADKVVGKAAALLFVLAGVRETYAPVMSERAAEVLSRFGIAYECGRMSAEIRNRAGTGPCPMERAVRDIWEPEEAFRAVLETLDALKGGGCGREENA